VAGRAHVRLAGRPFRPRAGWWRAVQVKIKEGAGRPVVPRDTKGIMSMQTPWSDQAISPGCCPASGVSIRWYSLHSGSLAAPLRYAATRIATFQVLNVGRPACPADTSRLQPRVLSPRPASGSPPHFLRPSQAPRPLPGGAPQSADGAVTRPRTANSNTARRGTRRLLPSLTKGKAHWPSWRRACCGSPRGSGRRHRPDPGRPPATQSATQPEHPVLPLLLLLAPAPP
jgi:hypothetical protein